nr:peptidylprolyl isomerase [Derxia gummosa]
MYLHGCGDFFEKIEERLAGQLAGFESEFHLEPEDAFGDYDAELLRVVPRAELPDELEPGMQFEGVPADGEDVGDEPLLWRVTDLTDEVAVLDGNHPLAGLALRVWVRVDDVRPATEEEIEQGHVSNEEALFRVVDRSVDDDDGFEESDDGNDPELDRELDRRGGTLH